MLAWTICTMQSYNIYVDMVWTLLLRQCLAFDFVCPNSLIYVVIQAIWEVTKLSQHFNNSWIFLGWGLHLDFLWFNKVDIDTFPLYHCHLPPLPQNTNSLCQHFFFLQLLNKKKIFNHDFPADAMNSIASRKSVFFLLVLLLASHLVIQNKGFI